MGKIPAGHVLLLCLLALFFLTGMRNAPVISASLNRWTSSSGVVRAASGMTILQGTIGQSFAYQANHGTNGLCAGFWCDSEPSTEPYTVFLPVLFKQR
jgi:hypothetical protein